jgi:hypothetical protein
MSRLAQIITAAILIALGALWSLQGIGYVTGSFMTGEPMWLIIGLASLAVGLTLLAWSLRRRR